MVREDILEGLKHAVSRGENLKDAMISFYNSGYSKIEIEDAAKELINQMNQQRQQSTSQEMPVQKEKSIKSMVQSIFQKKPEQQIPQQTEVKPQMQEIPKPEIIKSPPLVPQQIHPKTEYKEQNQQKIQPLIKPLKEIVPTTQEVSKYEHTIPTRKKKIMIILIFFLIILMGMLIGLFLFKEEILKFLSNFI